MFLTNFVDLDLIITQKCKFFIKNGHIMKTLTVFRKRLQTCERDVTDT